MNNFGVGCAEYLENGCNLYGGAIILIHAVRHTIIQYSIFIIHSNSKSLNRAINREFVRPKDQGLKSYQDKLQLYHATRNIWRTL